MAKNTGKDYEKLTRFIFEQIVDQDRVNTIKVEHDVVIPGKSTSHQIDVYWEFEIGEEKYRTIVQAKDWKSKVPQVQMLAFNNIIQDLPYGTRGIFVSASGFQKGAIEVAQANGITIYELRPPKDEDWDGYIKIVEISVTVATPVYRDIKFSIDESSLKNKEGITSNRRYDFHACGEDYFYDVDHVAYLSYSELINLLIAKSPNGVEHIVHEFEKETYILLDGAYVRINAVMGNFGRIEHNEIIKIDASDFVSYVLKDILRGKSFEFDKECKMKCNQTT